MHTSQYLSPKNKQERLQFCQWLLTHDDDWFQHVVWTDEKWFVLKNAPNKKNDHFWSPINPHAVVDCKIQGGVKMMTWAAMIDGRFLPLHWFIDEQNRSVSVDGAQYLRVLQEVMWPNISHISTRKQYWFMHDGARPHTTDDNLNFLHSKFRERIISRRSEIVWPAASPDLNPLDFWFWGYADAEVFRREPRSLQELMETVEDFCACLDMEMIRSAVLNVKKRAQLCVAQKGGHFETHL
jgi:inhibitor of nuclear factor kappa-B kinase subunit alpha